MMVGDGHTWWTGGKKVTGMSKGWWGFASAAGLNERSAGMSKAVADRKQWKNDGMQDPITHTELVDLTEVPSPRVRTPTTYPPHS